MQQACRGDLFRPAGAGVGHQQHGQRLIEGGAGKVIHHEVGDADVAEQLGADRNADEDGVRKEALGDEHPAAAAGKPEKMRRSDGDHKVDEDRYRSYQNVFPGCQQILVGHVVQDPGETVGGNTDVHDEQT